jgi:flavin-binding protein dodecin
MSVAKITEIQSSSKGFEDAIQEGIARADRTLRNLTGAGSRVRRSIEKGKITEYRVQVTFVLQD